MRLDAVSSEREPLGCASRKKPTREAPLSHSNTFAENMPAFFSLTVSRFYGYASPPPSVPVPTVSSADVFGAYAGRDAHGVASRRRRMTSGGLSGDLPFPSLLTDPAGRMTWPPRWVNALVEWPERVGVAPVILPERGIVFGSDLWQNAHYQPPFPRSGGFMTHDAPR